MANFGKTPKSSFVPQSIQDDGITVSELRQMSDSLIENIGALRFSIQRIEVLDGYRLLMRDLLADCRVVVDAHGPKSLVRKIDKVLKDTGEV